MVTFIRRPQICPICGLLYVITKNAHFTEGGKKAPQRYKSLCVAPTNIEKYRFLDAFLEFLDEKLIHINHFAQETEANSEFKRQVAYALFGYCTDGFSINCCIDHNGRLEILA